MMDVATEQEWLDDWEALLRDIDKTDIPIRFVRGVKIAYKEPELSGKEEEHIDLFNLRQQGWDNSMLNELVETVLTEDFANIQAVNFLLDVSYIAKVAQNHTDTYLIKT